MVEIEIKVKDRVDKILSSELKISRNKALNLLKNGDVFLLKQSEISPNSSKISLTKASQILEIGEILGVKIPKESEISKVINDSLIPEIIYEDSEILVINKPSGMIVHEANDKSEYSLVDYLRDRNFPLSDLGDARRAGIVHRLDKDTSGAMVVAKTNFAHKRLARQLKDRSMGRYYLAFINLALKDNLIINRPIGRNPKNRLKKAIIQDGRESKTAFLNLANSADLVNFSNLENLADLSNSTSLANSTDLENSTKISKISAQNSQKTPNLIAAKLFSGRTHQIRVHLNSINRYILGDNLYGFKPKNGKIVRLMLHAYIIYFTHPASGKRVEFVAGFDDEFKKQFENFNDKDGIYEKISPNFITSSFDDISDWLCYE